MSAVVQVKDLSKRYYIGKKQSGSLRETLSHAAGNLFSKTESEEFWALKDVSFEVQQGEVLGIIGKNGAGKSTLLKILSRITEPTTGSVVIDGRVSSLLEVGTGFHPELTGRENIFLNGAILGMKRAEIRKKFDEIVAFSGIEQFIDTPVKRYSSGMYVRLAFAVAAHLEPEILIIDEVLAVGDAEFQKKCLGKMKDVSEQDGRTVLFVSHNMEAVQNLCNKVMLLKQGEVISSGQPADVVTRYLHLFTKNKTEQHWETQTAPGNEIVKLMCVQVFTNSSSTGAFYTNSDLILQFEFKYLRNKSTNIDVTFHLIDERGILVLVGSSAYTHKEYFADGIIKATALIPGNVLNQGTYTVSRLIFVENRGQIVYEHHDTLTFEILPVPTGRDGWMGAKEGVLFLPQMQWTLQQVT